MERRVIKVSLVGTIFALILIIAGIVAIVWGVISINSGNKSNNSSSQQEQNQEQEAEPSIPEEKEKVVIDGKTQEIVVEKYSSNRLSFIITYSPSLFEVEKESNKREIFKLKETDEVVVEIEKKEEEFIDKSRDLATNEAKKKKEDASYTMDIINLNGKLCYIEKRIKDGDVYMEYTIGNGKSYYAIYVRIGKNYVYNYQPIIEKILGTFNVM